MQSTLDTYSLTRCHCAWPAVGDSNNSHCRPVKAERLREVICGLAQSLCLHWSKSLCALRLSIICTAPRCEGDALSLSIIVHTCRPSRFRRSHESRQSGMTDGTSNMKQQLWDHDAVVYELTVEGQISPETERRSTT
jgi:hypothetical protein